MSQAYLVMGVPMNDLLKQEKKVETVTRYHEETGKPYDKEVSETFYTLCGQRLEDGDEDHDSLFRRHGLEAITGGYDSDRPTVVGICAYSVAARNSSGGLLELIDPHVINGAAERAEKNLKRIGYTGPIKMYLVMRESF